MKNLFFVELCSTRRPGKRSDESCDLSSLLIESVIWVSAIFVFCAVVNTPKSEIFRNKNCFKILTVWKDQGSQRFGHSSNQILWSTGRNVLTFPFVWLARLPALGYTVSPWKYIMPHNLGICLEVLISEMVRGNCVLPIRWPELFRTIPLWGRKNFGFNCTCTHCVREFSGTKR